MKNIAVIGAGTMGNGIAHVFAMHEFEVSLVDISDEALTKAIENIKKNLWRMVAKEKISEEKSDSSLKNITVTTNLEEAVAKADIVIEAASENVDIKLGIFKKIDEFAKPSCILASNTSSISSTQIAAVTSRPEKVIGMHFMNPVPVMKLIEVIRGYSTSDETTEIIMKMSKDIGKIPVEVNDYPGFVANRILMPMLNEAIMCVYQGVAGVKEIDSVMKLGMAHPMGPLQLADFIGLDICKAIMEVLYDGFGEAKYAPCPLLTNMVAAKQLGRKTGVGFYDYSGGGKEYIVAEKFSKK